MGADETPRIEATPRSSSPDQRCPFCREPLAPADARRACAACGAEHHADCWGEVGRCAACIHDVKPRLWPLRPERPLITSPGEALLWAAVVLLVVLGAGGVMAWVSHRGPAEARGRR